MINLDVILKCPERAQEVPPSEIPKLLAELAALQITLSTRLMNGTTPASVAKPATAPLVPMDDLLDVKQVCGLLKVKPQYIYELCRRGELHTILIGKRAIRIPRSSLVDFLKARAEISIDTVISRTYSINSYDGKRAQTNQKTIGYDAETIRPLHRLGGEQRCPAGTK
jgi:excisionase family DNA binding protein